MADDSFAYYRLKRIDGAASPTDLEYRDAQCVITDGDLVLRRHVSASGDGMICVRLFGSAFGITQVDQIFLEREAFDRLDAEYLTFPGGWRHQQGIAPHSVVQFTDDGVEVSALNSASVQRDATRTFRPHRWTFVKSEHQLPGSDAQAAG